MKMEMQMDFYWPQRKVFLYGISALFPERLDAQAADKDELARYSPSSAVSDLMEYLREYQSDKLTTGKMTKPEVFTSQQERLVLAARAKFSKYGYRPVISLTDLRQDSDDKNAPATTFWELIFTEHLITGYIRIVNIGYDGTVPFAEFEVVGDLFRKAIAPPRLRKALQSRVTMGEKSVCIMLPNGTKHPLKPIRFEGAQYNFMQYVLANPDRSIDITEIHDRVAGCKTKPDMTELARECGFDKGLKRAFFPGTSAGKVYFKPVADLSSAQINTFSKSV